jgi:hypothetical protein
MLRTYWRGWYSEGFTDAWRSALEEPRRYKAVTPTEPIAGVDPQSERRKAGATLRAVALPARD